MKKFCKDYVELCKEGCKFMKDHWMGCIIFYIIWYVISLAIIFREDIIDYLEDVFESAKEKLFNRFKKEA